MVWIFLRLATAGKGTRTFAGGIAACVSANQLAVGDFGMSCRGPSAVVEGRRSGSAPRLLASEQLCHVDFGRPPRRERTSQHSSA